MPPHSYAYSAPTELNASILRCLLRLHDAALHTSTSARLHRDSRAPYLHVSTSPSPQRAFRALELRASTSLHLQRTFRTPRCYACSEPLDLHTSTSYAYSAPAEFHTIILLWLHVCTPAARLQRSIPPRLHACIATPELHPCTSPLHQIRRAPPEL